jgi:antitoxin ChpS
MEAEMATVTLRQVGGSLSFAVPPAIKESLGLTAGAVLDISIEHGRLVAKPERPRYSIDELIARCDLSAPYPDEAHDWIDAPPVGRELL